MKLKTLVAGAAVVAGLAGFAASSPLPVTSSVKLGAWCGNFTAAKAYADENNIPMVVFWANPGCSQCEKLEAACKKAEFTDWMASRQLVMVFGYGATTADMKACKAFAKSGKEYPFVAVYWKANTAGEGVLERFTGRSGKFGHGTTSSQALWEQFAGAVDNILADWKPGSVTPVEPTPEPTPDPDPTPEPTPDPEPTPEPIDVETLYRKAQSLSAIVYDASESPVGTATIKTGKINARKGTVKVSVSGTLLTGKKVSATRTLVPESDGSLVGELAFKSPVGGMSFELAYDVENEAFVFSAENEDYFVVSGANVGGAFDVEELSFSAEFDELDLPEGYDLVVDAPSGEPVSVTKNGTKLACGKAASPKYKKVDGEYELTGLDDEKKPNLTGLKLTYSASKGTFTGSFKIYASNEGETSGKPKLKKYTAKVTGIVIDGVGAGSVTVKVGKETFTGTCTLD